MAGNLLSRLGTSLLLFSLVEERRALVSENDILLVPIPRAFDAVLDASLAARPTQVTLRG